jgi:hypothetical protein
MNVNNRCCDTSDLCRGYLKGFLDKVGENGNFSQGQDMILPYG